MQNSKYSREISVAVFIDKDKNVLLQNRTNHSKAGEKYGFFGGGIEPNETSEEALIRELKEELNYTPNTFQYIGSHEFIVDEESSYKGKLIKVNYFISPITEHLLDTKVNEGVGMELVPLEKAVQGSYLSKYDVGALAPLKETIEKYTAELV